MTRTWLWPLVSLVDSETARRTAGLEKGVVTQRASIRLSAPALRLITGEGKRLTVVADRERMPMAIAWLRISLKRCEFVQGCLDPITKL
jgi:hypothetical protein